MKTTWPKIIYKAKFSNIHKSKNSGSRTVKSKSFVSTKRLDTSLTSSKKSSFISKWKIQMKKSETVSAFNMTQKYKQIVTKKRKSKSKTWDNSLTILTSITKPKVKINLYEEAKTMITPKV